MLKPLDELSAIPEDQEGHLNKGQRIEKYLIEHYEFRYNVVKNSTEYRSITNGKEWLPISNYDLNSIVRELRDVFYYQLITEEDGNGEEKTKKKKVYLTTAPGKLAEMIESSFAPKVDVIKEYLLGLSYTNYTGDAIEQLVKTVKLASWYGPTEKEYWRSYLTKWLVGCVANILVDWNCENHLCLVLVGEQGLKKGFWIERLVQDALGPNYIRTDGDFQPNSKDCKAAIGSYWLIHLDDMLKRINLRDYNEIKNAITTPDVKIRLPYKRFDEVLPHRASFIATVNDKHFLTDTTGARRFMPFEIESIDYDAFKEISMRDVWTNAMYLHNQDDYKHWIDPGEETSLRGYKENFAVEFTEEGLLMQWYRPYVKNIDDVSTRKLMTSTMILKTLSENTVFRNLSDKKLGGLLKKNGFNQVSARFPGSKFAVRAYEVIERPVEDREVLRYTTDIPKAPVAKQSSLNV